MSEATYKWEDLTDMQQGFIIAAHAHILKVKRHSLARIFDLVKPTVVIGENEGKPYCRIADESREVMILLIKNYA